MEMELRQKEFTLKEREFALKVNKTMADVTEQRTKALKNVADAEAAEQGSQLAVYDAFINNLMEMRKDFNAGQQGREPPPSTGGAGTDNGAGMVGMENNHTTEAFFKYLNDYRMQIAAKGGGGRR